MHGFASGKEIYIFFSQYGLCGIIGIFISTLIFEIITYKVLKIVILKKEISNYNEFLNYIFKNNRQTVSIINSFINIFLLILFFVMIAGFSAYFKQEFNIPIYIGNLIISLVCFFTLKNNINGIIKISSLLISIIIFFIFNIGIKDINNSLLQILKMDFIYNNLLKSIISSILYVNYNCILLIPILISLKKFINKNNIKYVVIIFGILLIILSLLIYCILLNGNFSIINLELPIIYIVKQHGRIYQYIYGSIIIIAIFTSVISAGYSLLNNCAKNKKQYNYILLLMCLFSCIIANFGFSNLINLLYPLFGLIGIFINYYILKRKI